MVSLTQQGSAGVCFLLGVGPHQALLSGVSIRFCLEFHTPGAGGLQGLGGWWGFTSMWSSQRRGKGPQKQKLGVICCCGTRGAAPWQGAEPGARDPSRASALLLPGVSADSPGGRAKQKRSEDSTEQLERGGNPGTFCGFAIN